MNINELQIFIFKILLFKVSNFSSVLWTYSLFYLYFYMEKFFLYIVLFQQQ